MRVFQLVAAVVFTCSCSFVHAQDALPYQKPPAPIQALLDAPTLPIAHLSPDRSTLLIAQPATYPSIADVAQPRFRLAGIRFNPQTNGPSREIDTVHLSLETIDGTDHPITGLPAKLKATHLLWSPDSKHIAFVQRADSTTIIGGNFGLELWVVDVATSRAHRVGTLHLNAVLEQPCQWMPDSSELLCLTIPANRAAPPKPSDVPAGPNVEENLGRVSPARTYEDMLKTPSDEAIFQYYATAQLARVSLTGVVRPLSAKGMIVQASPSPDGRFALVSEIHRPFSYTLPEEMFPRRTFIVDLKSGAIANVLYDRPIVDNLPIAFDAVPAGPRDYDWRSDAPATVAWAEAADHGDPNAKVDIHDRLFILSAPFTAQPTLLAELPMRFRGVDWGTDQLALLTESRWSDRHIALLALNPSTPPDSSGKPAKPITLYEGSSQDRYHSPGRPLLTTNAAGHEVLELTPDGSAIYFVSPGATPKGEQPFLATLPITGGPETILFRSSDPYFTDPIALLANNKLLVRRESVTDPPNYFAVALGSPATPAPDDFKQLTKFPNPYAGIKLPTRQLIHYQRPDGVELTASLWLPAG
jgi:dipeptidyl aminopeptidase/acylaminoacyl peptidase